MQTFESTKHRDYERFEAYRLYEEKTDIGERLSLPIHNAPRLEVIAKSVYGYDIHGELRRMTEWSKEAYDDACQDLQFSGLNQIERTRRKLELDEAEVVETLSVGESLHVLSPIPDVVMDGNTTLDGYRTDLARTFYRAYYRHEDHVETMTLSLEQSNKQALWRVGVFVGMSLPENMQSETVLASRHRKKMSHDEFEMLADTVRYQYDASLKEQTGITFFAGNRLANHQESMQFIDAHHAIIDEHMSFIRSIEQHLSGVKKKNALEGLRQRTAAALDAILHGTAITSITDGSVDTRLASGSYGGECAIGTTQNTQEAMGLAQGKHTTNCPLCGTKGVTATVEGATITCSSCLQGVDICTGKIIPKKKSIQKSPPLIGPSQSTTQSTQDRDKYIREVYGEHGRSRTKLVIGGAVREIYDVRTQTILAIEA